MPKRTDIKKILIIGSGPIVIGQACEFDYSGTQACRVLREDGYKIILVNSNPATIMTDPEVADRTYIEPMTTDILTKVIEKERPDALLPTLGGQTGLNLSVTLAEEGILDKFNVELIGAKLDAIKKAENRKQFKEAMENIGIQVPASGYAKSLKEAKEIVKYIKYPVIIRPSFTLGGIGGNVAYNVEELDEYVNFALEASPVHEILIERSVLGWKEYELEVMRDNKDNVVIICSIENLDPMGVHTGDSITVAPAQTLTDKEYQIMRDAAIKIIREIGVETGGSNVQFAINPSDGELIAIEMNPRVSRSSALASKATGFPIAKIAAKLAVGYTLDEIPNDITRYTPASFEPSIDYCVVKIPKFNFEKFPDANQILTTHMKSVGEVMAIGRTFKESLGKAIRSLEISRNGLSEYQNNTVLDDVEKEEFTKKYLLNPSWDRLWYVVDGMRMGMNIDEIYEVTRIDKWFLYNIKQILELEEEIKSLHKPGDLSAASADVNGSLIDPVLLKKAKQYGISDIRLANLLNVSESDIRNCRWKNDIRPVFKVVDTCAAEFQAYTPYLYSTYETECEANPTPKKKIIILGSGPNRIGQGIEFDYCCVHGVLALREMGFETIMINCNPETVSTDYDISDRLYFEPLTFEDVFEIVEKEKPEGIIVQFGGQTPLKLAVPLANAGVKILGTSPDSIDIAENRGRFASLLSKLGLLQPNNGNARSFTEAEEVANSIGYPVLIRPSYVLGGRAMRVVFDEGELEEYMSHAVDVSPEHPVLIDKFLEGAIELDVDAVCDGEDVLIGGVMEHIEEAGVHSGDSACSLPPYSVKEEVVERIKSQTRALAIELKVLGIINIQFAVKDDVTYVLEVNPRGSRTIPFVSKAIGIPLAKIASQVIAGRKLKELNINNNRKSKHVAVKEAVFPFVRFHGTDTILGPEMKSTGEVMGVDADFGKAFAKAQMAIEGGLPQAGTVFISVRDKDKAPIVDIAHNLYNLGFKISATGGTARAIAEKGTPVTTVLKEYEGRPNVIDLLKNNDIQLVINTAEGKISQKNSYNIRRHAIVSGIPYFTTVPGAIAAESAIRSMSSGELDVKPIQEYHM
ncbi:MAG: carbamoyl-phosphate synthase large subunit [Planctomycetota bacterium]|jgi:carbamoyl-phosphate synthase large subunit